MPQDMHVHLNRLATGNPRLGSWGDRGICTAVEPESNNGLHEASAFSHARDPMRAMVISDDGKPLEYDHALAPDFQTTGEPMGLWESWDTSGIRSCSLCAVTRNRIVHPQ